MSSKLSKWLFYIPREREFSDAGYIFTYVHEHFSGPLTGGGGGDRPYRALYGSTTAVKAVA